MNDTVNVSRELLRQVLEALEDGLHFRKTGLGRPPEQYNPPAIDALRAALEQPAVEPVNFDQIAADRYKVVEAHESLFHRWAVVAGNGVQQLYVGREVECQNMARKFAGAFLDGAWLASQHTAPQAQQPAVGHVSELVDYILQDDTHNRLTPRVVDIAYSAFMIAKQGKNKDDGGPCDWFNDTKPMVMNQLAKIKKDLAEKAAPVRESAPQAQQPRKAVKLSDEEIEDACWTEVDRRLMSFARAVEQAVWEKLGVME